MLLVNKLTVGVSSLALMLAVHSTAQAAHQHHAKQDDIQHGIAFGGLMDVQSSMTHQDIDRGYRETMLSNDTELHLTYRKQAELGFTYGAVIEMEADVTEDFREEGGNADKTYLFLESNLGRLELGAVDDAAHRLSVGAESIAVATGGIHGDWFQYAHFPADMHGGHHGGSMQHLGHGDFLHFPALPQHHAHGAAEDSNKLSYYSPMVHGVQAGFSYSPDSGDSGTIAGASGKAGHRDFNDVLHGGVSWQGNFSEVGVKASVTGETGRAELRGHEHLGAWAAGVQVDYHDFSLAGSYGDWNKSVTHISSTTEDAHYTTLGAAYQIGDVGVSLGWLNSTYDSNDAEVVSLGADYRLAAGLTPYAEWSHIQMEAADTLVQDNTADVLIVGIELNF